MRILGISGSIIGEKTPNILYQALKKLDKHYKFIDLRMYEMEFCDGREWYNYNLDTKEIVSHIINAEAIIIATPIYQASIPGLLKNLLDILPEHALRNKKVGIIGIGGTPKHHLAIEYQLKPILNFMKADVINKYVFVDRGENKDLDYRLNNLILELEK